MLIRSCDEKDLEKIVKIEEESFDHPYPLKIFEDYLGEELFLIAEVQGVVGYVIGEEREEHGLIVSIAVSPSRRDEGIGTALMRSVQEKMLVDTILVTVRPSSDVLLHLRRVRLPTEPLTPCTSPEVAFRSPTFVLPKHRGQVIASSSKGRATTPCQFMIGPCLQKRSLQTFCRPVSGTSA